ncbi:ABC transporter ATP-binding protein [Iamia sp. SCSIO 61187]|uniref:ABC transporter ATP-binding protein n=1 Tax=Iamia sp. SCSIO 61187 TaxID=2722752 RepID=UPI001C624FEE|nr:ABC transporter ATP-binding protein [Iamia sp. SCSIO 61187]QYG92460.1 ABC transporter ATP-binding protein [Iamia sp. SCSIO 61187]
MRAGPGLSVDVSVALGALDLVVALDVAPGEVVGLIGPNGAGKTTLLRTLAGLRRATSGRIVLDGVALDEPGAGRFVPAEQRPVGMVFQDLRLFPHLTARDDVAFGLRARRVPRATAHAVAADWLERVGLADRAGDRTTTLSGGQAQRVALARALAPDPALLLLDEPLSALDAGTKAEVRRVLRAHLAAFAGPAVVVTHDAVDALTLTDRLVVLDHGRVVQVGAPAEVARRPLSRWVADLVGLTLVPGVLGADGGVEVGGGHVLATVGADAARPGDGVHVAIRPGAVALFRARPEGSPRNVWPAVVSGLEAAADRVRVQVAGPVDLTADITHAALADLALVPGDDVWVSVKATELDVYPR